MTSSPIGKLEYLLLIALVIVVFFAVLGLIEGDPVGTAVTYFGGRRWA